MGYRMNTKKTAQANKYENLCNEIDITGKKIKERTTNGPNYIIARPSDMDKLDKIDGSITKGGIEIPHGHKFDAGKARMELLPIGGIRLAASIMTGGANKYNENNWTGLKASRVIGAGMRHLQQFLGGQDHDNDSHQHHLGHFLANLMMVHHIVNNFPDQDDRIYWGQELDADKYLDKHIYRPSRGSTGVTQYTLLPPDSLEAAAKWMTAIAGVNGDHWWQYDELTVKSYIEFILDEYLSFANREISDLGRAIANTMIVIERLNRSQIEDDRIFNYLN